jgi:hypothetical protein
VYERLARALAHSAAANSPATPLDLIRPDPEHERLAGLWRRGHDPQRDSLLANTRKLEIWQEAVEAAPAGEVLGLLDCDLLILGDLSEIDLLRFDIAYTARPPGAAYPLNGGVIFARVSERSRCFMADWRKLNARMLADPRLHEPARQRFGGINQAALGVLLGRSGVDARALPCATWNCEDASWSSFNPRTKIVHVKSQLRQACFGERALEAWSRPLVDLWKRHAYGS